MKFTIDTEAMLKGLANLAKVIPAHPVLPVMSNFLFELKGSELHLTAMDGEMLLKTEMNVEGAEGEGSAAIPAKIFMDLVKAMPSKGFTVEINENGLLCTWETGRSTLPVFQAGDFPEFRGPDPEGFRRFGINGGDLATGITKTAFAVAKNESQPALCGVFFDIRPSGSAIVACDSHKLVVQSVSTPCAEEGEFILSSRVAKVLKDIVSKNDALVFDYDGRSVAVRTPNYLLMSVTMDGKYPRYRTVIPEGNENVLSVERRVLLDVLKRMNVCADQRSSIIKVNLSFNEMNLTAQDLEMQTFATECLECDYDGDDMEIGFKAPFFIETVSSMDADSIEIRFKDSRKAILLQPSAEERKDEPFEAVLMPVLVG